MGVTVLQQFPMTENRTGPQTIEFLTKRVVALGAVQVGQFLVDCETYMSVPQLGKYISIYKLVSSAEKVSLAIVYVHPIYLSLFLERCVYINADANKIT
ncbi:hypothetical protein ACFW04_012054 [Cataglyphis niger]